MKKQQKAAPKYLGYFLEAGVILSAIFLLSGGFRFLYRFGFDKVNYSVFQGDGGQVSTLFSAFDAPNLQPGNEVMLVGLLILIFLPLLRVIICGVQFAFEGNKRYVAVSLLLALLLIYSLMVERVIPPPAHAPQTTNSPCSN